MVVSQEYGRFPDDEHKEDFLQSVRTRRRPNGDVEPEHLSALLCHFANISFRVGNQHLAVDSDRERFVDLDQANALLRPERRTGFEIPAEV